MSEPNSCILETYEIEQVSNMTLSYELERKT